MSWKFKCPICNQKTKTERTKEEGRGLKDAFFFGRAWELCLKTLGCGGIGSAD